MGLMEDKLEELLELEGYEDDLDLFLNDCLTDSVCPGICMNDLCSYTTEVEPDNKEGWCEFCEDQTVCSGMILAGVM